MEEQNDETLDLLKRGGVSKGLYEQQELEEYKWLYEEEKELTNFGHLARVVDDLPVKMIVFDEKAVMFALNEPMSLSPKLTMISIEHNDIATACKILFNNVWDKGIELNQIKINHKNYVDK